MPLDLQPEHANLLAEHANDVVCLSDRQGTIRWISPAVSRLLGQRPQDLIGARLPDLVAGDDRDALERQLHHPGSEGGELYVRLQVGDGMGRWIGVSTRPIDSRIPDADVVSCWRDRTAEMEVRAQLQRIQDTDPLTGLACGEVLLHRLQQRLSDPARANAAVALLCIGIDQLSQVNGALSHRAGDRLVADLASRLMTATGPEDLLARGSGDSFLVLLHDSVSAEASAIAAAERMRQACRSPFGLEGQVLNPSVSIGIALAAPDDSADALLRDAHLAMRQASAEGRDRWVMAHRDLSEGPRRSLQLQQEIRSALEAEAFRAWFMPVVDLASGTCSGFEALMRWVRPDGSVVMPDDVLPTARGSALAESIDLAILRQSIQRLSALSPTLFVAANITPSTRPTWPT